jgi:tetratricopeptide (TPR) repeat protein
MFRETLRFLSELRLVFWLTSFVILSCQPPSTTTIDKYSIDSLTVSRLEAQAKGLVAEGNFQHASRILDTAISIGGREKIKSLPLIHYQQGIASAELGRFDKSLDHFKRCLSYFESDTARKSKLDHTHYQIGLVYYRLNDFDKSIEYLNKVRASNLSMEARIGLLIDKALTLAAQNHFNESHDLLEQADSQVNDDRLRAKLLFAKGRLAWQTKDRRSAGVFFARASKLARNIALPRVWIESDLYLSQISVEGKDLITAGKILNSAEKEAERLGLSDLKLQCYNLNAELNLALGNYAVTTRYQDKFLKLRDAQYGEELLHKISALQVEFEERHQVQKIKEQEELMQLKEKSLHQSMIVNTTVALICLLLIAILIALMLNYKTTRQLNTELDTIVKDKTSDLERIHSKLRDENYKRQFYIKDASRCARSAMASINGICIVCRIDTTVGIPSKDIDLIEQTTSETNVLVEQLAKYDLR